MTASLPTLILFLLLLFGRARQRRRRRRRRRRNKEAAHTSLFVPKHQTARERERERERERGRETIVCFSFLGHTALATFSLPPDGSAARSTCTCDCDSSSFHRLLGFTAYFSFFLIHSSRSCQCVKLFPDSHNNHRAQQRRHH